MNFLLEINFTKVSLMNVQRRAENEVGLIFSFLLADHARKELMTYLN